MTNWAKHGSTLEIRHQYVKSFEEFLGTLAGNVNGKPLWEIDAEEGEINPISYSTVIPENYLATYLEIIKWLKKKRLNCEAGYAFTYQDDENPDDRSVGGINSNNEGVTFCLINGDGKITHEFHKI